MIPITQALTARFIANESEGLQAISTIQPVEGAKAEVPLWNRLRQGMQFTGQVLHKESSSAQSMPGQPVPLATYQVQLNLPQQAPQLVWMQLPENMNPQQLLQLQVMGNPQNGQPQVKWVPADAPNTQAGIQAARYSGLTNEESAPSLLEDANLGHPGGVASQVELSPPAKTLQQWVTSPLFSRTPPGIQAQNVVTQHPEKAQVLAQDLKHALDSSGLFYESHLKEATLGARAWQSLMQEPQNSLRFDAQTMVSQQLHVLEQQRVIWHGEVWPGQQMQWQVTEREAKNATPQQEEATQTLFSNLSMTLPKLGEVNVRITMIDGRFSIRVQADNPDSRKTLSAAKQQLTANLTQAGLALDGLQVTEGALHVVQQAT